MGRGKGETLPHFSVGSETVIEMVSMDFEELLRVSGISDAVIPFLREKLKTGSPVDEVLHCRMKELLLPYVVAGGMPEKEKSFRCAFFLKRRPGSEACDLENFTNPQMAQTERILRSKTSCLPSKQRDHFQPNDFHGGGRGEERPF